MSDDGEADSHLRRVDPALTKRALNQIKRIEKRLRDGDQLTDWEEEFVESVKARLKQYGSAFADPDKGALNAPLSLRQGLTLKAMRKKAKPKQETPEATDGVQAKPRKPLARRGGLKTKRPMKRSAWGLRRRPQKQLNAEDAEEG